MTSSALTLASGYSRSATRLIFFSSSIRWALLCRRPAVSTMSMSAWRPRAACIPSKTTAAGSAPSFCLMMGTSARSAQTVSCSAAAARKVSAAQMMTRRPTVLKRVASFPMVVVLPTPLTPMTSRTMGLSRRIGSVRIMSASMSLSASRAASAEPIFSALHFSRRRLTANSVVFMPTSAMMSTSLRSSKNSSSSFL